MSNKRQPDDRARRRGIIITAVVLGLIALGLYVGFIVLQMK